MEHGISLQSAESFARARLSEGRYRHTLRVTECAVELAARNGLDAEKVHLAALLHDAAREVRPEELLSLAEKWDLPVGDEERASPKLLHGPVAAELARRELGISDGEVLEAVRVHTTGQEGMSPVALAVYVADKIEPARDYPSVGMLRELARRDLREAAAEALRRTAAYNEGRGKTTHPASRRALEWLER